MAHNLANPDKDLRIIFSIEKFYKNSKTTIVTNAAHGWHYVAGFEKNFVENAPVNRSENLNSSDKDDINKDDINKVLIEHDPQPETDPAKLLTSLNQTEPLDKKFKKLKEIIADRDPNLINDSFGHDVDIVAAQERTFRGHKLNIVIIGSGVTGLYLACVTKFVMGDDVNILVLDNRSKKQNTREIFNREWLTHLPFEIFHNCTPANIRGLLGCFGVNGLIGLHINLLEAILMLSCKEQGVKFYFSPNIDCTKLNHQDITCMFDATGGRLSGYDYTTTIPHIGDLNLSNLLQNYHYVGPSTSHSNGTDVDISLISSGAVHLPYIGNIRINTHMFKITGIPGRLLNAVHHLIEPLNAKNSFYLWKGGLKDKLNEGLVFVNILRSEFEILTANYQNTMNLKSFLVDKKHVYSSLNDDIRLILKQLEALDDRNRIKINRPFSYSPHINLHAGFECMGEKRIFPVGDSYFKGHPKVGNGLWTHLGFINELVMRMAASAKRS